MSDTSGARSNHTSSGGSNKSTPMLDVTDFLIGTGVRASEALALTWDRVFLGGPVPFVQIDRTVIRVRGRGLVIQDRTKTGDVRLLALPAPVVRMLKKRLGSSAGERGPVFTSARGTLIDPSNMRKQWREALKGTEFAWVTQKTLRKSVATALNADSGSLYAAAQLGHASDSVTRQFYIERPRSPHDARSSLDAFLPHGRTLATRYDRTPANRDSWARSAAADNPASVPQSGWQESRQPVPQWIPRRCSWQRRYSSISQSESVTRSTLPAGSQAQCACLPSSAQPTRMCEGFQRSATA